MARRKKKETDTDPKTVATQQQLAGLLGKCGRTVREYLARGMREASAAALAEGDQGYHVAACRAWVAEHVTPSIELGDHDKGQAHQLHKLTLAKMAAEVRFRQIKTEQLEGLLVDRAAVRQAWNEAMLRIQTRLEAWPDELEMLWPAESRAITKAEHQEKTRLLLLEMSQWSTTIDPPTTEKPTSHD